MASVTTPMDAQAIAATLTEQLGRPGTALHVVHLQ